MSELKETGGRPEIQKATVQDVVTHLKKELVELEEVVAKENLDPEDHIRPEQWQGDHPDWNRDAFVPRREAITELERGNPEKARAYLDQQIEVAQRTTTEPFWNYHKGREPKDSGAAERIKAEATQKLTDLERLRAALGES